MKSKKHYKNSRFSASSGPHNPEAGLRYFGVRAGALAALSALIVLAIFEVRELRGELAFRRFYRLEQAADKCRGRETFSRVVKRALSEGELVMLFGKRNPDALWEVSAASLRWSQEEKLHPVLRLRLAENAVSSAALAVQAAPSAYEFWFLLARAEASLGLAGQAEMALKRAQELAPPGRKLRLFRAASESAKSPPLRTAARKLQEEQEK